MNYFWAYLAGAGVLVVYFLVCWRVVGSFAVWRLAEGQDGRLSTSKMQWLLWTAAAAFAYVTVFTARALQGDHTAINSIPRNLLLALGFSTVTMATAKGITTAYVAQGRNLKPPATPGPAATGAGAAATSTLGDLVQDDSGGSDLSKTQLVVWTLISISIFMVNVVVMVDQILGKGAGAVASSLPDIDASLMVLSGLSQGGYLGKKLVTSSTLQLTSLIPSSVALADAGAAGALALYGTGFGDGAPGGGQPSDSALTVNGFAVTPDSWSATKITFHLDPAASFIATLPAGTQALDIGVVVGGQPSSPTCPLTLVK